MRCKSTTKVSIGALEGGKHRMMLRSERAVCSMEMSRTPHFSRRSPLLTLHYDEIFKLRFFFSKPPSNTKAELEPRTRVSLSLMDISDAIKSSGD